MTTICGYVGPDLFAGPISMFYDWHDENGAAPNVKASGHIGLHSWRTLMVKLTDKVALVTGANSGMKYKQNGWKQ